MTKEEALKEIERIVDEEVIASDKIAQKAMEEGRWKPGLDANGDLFKGLQLETELKIKEILDQVEE